MSRGAGQSGAIGSSGRRLRTSVSNDLPRHEWCAPCSIEGVLIRFPPSMKERVRIMRTVRSRKPAGRDERQSAAWGKRLKFIAMLAAVLAFGPLYAAAAAAPSRIASELSGLLS